ncbi:MAG: YqiA/YcfP family alpha/beta fold hydrolase [Elainellaceae cyanobacterium]
MTCLERDRPSMIYLHGFASSPASAKAQYLGDRLREAGITVAIPDLNQDDFSHLNLTRQLQQVQEILATAASPVTLIGSSFGGLTAAWLAEQAPTVDRLVLLAPAFQFLDHWLPRLGADQVAHWQSTGYLQVYHYTAQAHLPLHYGFITDAQTYDQRHLKRSLPTLILHGRSDEVIPLSASRTYAGDRPWVSLVELDDDHSLGKVQPQLWQAIQEFCGIPDA